ncbi:hypothetical protein TFLX_04527 [Thermoflexales bacterium]|nr:hypothetical protein TFLX_04527 [Thermoflexales bacterium]
MSYHTLFSHHNLALLNDWLAETGELYVDVHLPHSGGSSTPYFIRTLSELKELVSQQTWPEIVFSIFHYRQYPLRGIADEHLLAQALQQISDGHWYRLVSLDDFYPSPCTFFGSGNSHIELQNDFSEVLGQSIGIGQDPLDVYDNAWFHSHPNEVFLLSATRNLSVTKNQNYHRGFDDYPGKYQTLIDMWQK